MRVKNLSKLLSGTAVALSLAACSAGMPGSDRPVQADPAPVLADQVPVDPPALAYNAPSGQPSSAPAHSGPSWGDAAMIGAAGVAGGHFWPHSGGGVATVGEGAETGAAAGAETAGAAGAAEGATAGATEGALITRSTAAVVVDGVEGEEIGAAIEALGAFLADGGWLFLPVTEIIPVRLLRGLR